MKLRQQDGFTLIELAITLIIVGLLAAMALPKFWEAKNRAYVSSVKSDLRALMTGQEIYFASHHSYATDPEVLTSVSEDVVVTVTYTQTGGWAATGMHPAAPDRTCGVRLGNAPLSAAPVALEPYAVYCAE